MVNPTDPPTAPASLPNYLADGLPRQSDKTLEDAREYVDELLEHRQQPVTADNLPEGAEPVEDVNTDSTQGTLVKERVKCGADCTCNDGTGHGPYLYRYFRVDGTLKSEYVGKP